MDATSQALLAAQIKAEALFAQVIERGLISAGKYESELTAEIHALAYSQFGLRRHWHRRIARCGPNTLYTYDDEPADRRIGEDDIVYLDFGPVFEAWEADFGRSYVLGTDPSKHRLVGDLETAFRARQGVVPPDPDLDGGTVVRLRDRIGRRPRLGIRRRHRRAFDRPFPARDFARR